MWLPLARSCRSCASAAATNAIHVRTKLPLRLWVAHLLWEKAASYQRMFPFGSTLVAQAGV